MPYKDPERKRQWEREHREERNARRRDFAPSAIDLSPNSKGVQSAGNGLNVAFGVVAGVSLLLILLFAGLRLGDFPKPSEGVRAV